MGGHGGLNILPQKSWNVYNFDAREKVERDEREHAETEARKRKRRLDIEFGAKFDELKAKQRRSVAAREDESRGEGVLQRIVTPEKPIAGVATLEAPQGHINLFEDMTSGNAEYAAEKAEEELGEKKQWQVQLGKSNCYGGADINHNPWYTERPALDEKPMTQRQLEEMEYQRRVAMLNSLPAGQRWGQLSLLSNGQPSGNHGEPDLLSIKPPKKDKKEKKKEKKQKKKEKKERNDPKKRLEALRQERLAREQVEHAREARLTSSNKPKPAAPEYRYNSGYARHLDLK